MTQPQPDWREQLASWRRTNPPKMPADDPRRTLHTEFLKRFPKEQLGQLTLAQYGLGHSQSADSFCYWLEWKTKILGSVSGGSVSKWGVWFDKESQEWRTNKGFKSPEDALAKLTSGLLALIAAVEAGHFDQLDTIGSQKLGASRYSLRGKPLHLYFPEHFLPISSPGHLEKFLSFVGLQPKGDLLACNRQLLAFFQEQPETKDMDTQQLSSFLYNRATPGQQVLPEIEGDPDPTIEELMQLMGTPVITRNVILYGPPGTGKTWIVNHFANYFLLHHNVSEKRADEYWSAVQRRDSKRQQTLQNEVRSDTPTTTDQPNFWFMVANEQQQNWSWQQLFTDKSVFFKLGSIRRNFALVQPGDFVFGYRARPHGEVIALAQVKQGLHQQTISGVTEEGIEIEPLGDGLLKNPVKWQTLGQDLLLQNAEPLRSNARGTLFKLTADEARALATLITSAGNTINLPDTPTSHTYAEFVTFHQSFAYEEFIEGLKPHTDAEGEISYAITAGVFRRICKRAQADPKKRYLLVIDEINRANIAKVFGELITLIEDDKRAGQPNAITVTLPYSQEQFSVPSNLFILGTMNTADRSIALLDIALRRRFTFLELMPDESLLSPIGTVDLSAVLHRLNERISILLDRDHQIGHSYLYGVNDLKALRFRWYRRIVPLVQEYFYNDAERIQAILGKAFIELVAPDAKLFDSGLAAQDIDRPQMVIQHYDGDDAGFLKALAHIAGS